jgi:hypothetical protein
MFCKEKDAHMQTFRGWLDKGYLPLVSLISPAIFKVCSVDELLFVVYQNVVLLTGWCFLNGLVCNCHIDLPHPVELV